MASGVSVTFALNPTQPTLGYLSKARSLTEYVLKEDRFPKGSTVLTSTDTSGGHVRFEQGLLDALYLAYSNHLNLVISPDDFWLSIMISLNNYMQYNSEAMRSVFVSHEGKAQLIIDTERSYTDQDWGSLLTQFEQKIAENITPGVAAALMPDFSTTTPHHKTVAQIFLMGVLKNYFSYGCCLMCGIPSVTMLGTLEDWQKLKSKIQFLRTLCKDFDTWVAVLEPICDRLLASYTGTPDLKWWNQIISYKGGSGTSEITGWALAFFPFHKGQWQLYSVREIEASGRYGNVETDNLLSYNSVHVELKVNEFGVMHDLALYAESRKVNFDTATDTVKPAFDWAIIKLPNQTITDKFDWDDRSVKVVDSNNNPLSKIDRPLPTPCLIASAGGSITSDHHPHPLLPHTLKVPRSHRCDVCQLNINQHAFSCRPCDFDICLGCLAAISTGHLSKQHPHRLQQYQSKEFQSVQCDGCQVNGIAHSYRCSACDFDLCADCIADLDDE